MLRIVTVYDNDTVTISIGYRHYLIEENPPTTIAI